MVLVVHGMLLHHAAHSSISFGSFGAGKKTLGVDAALSQWVISPSSCSSLAIFSAAAAAAALFVQLGRVQLGRVIHSQREDR